MNLRQTLWIIAFIFIVSPLKIFAATDGSIMVDIVPPNPEPHSETVISLSSYSYNLDAVRISWSVDGKNITAGVGQKTFSVTAPAAGSTANIVATISLPDGTVETKVALQPSVTVLLWETNDSFVPPFYRGKALPSLDSEIKVVAMPEIRAGKGAGLTDPRNLTYVWKKDYTNNPEASGYGRNFFNFVSDYLEDSSTISVIASTVDQNFSGEASVNIRTSQPRILFYKNDPAFGTLWQKAVGDHRMEGSELLEAAPYFISPKELYHPSLVWNWFINGLPVSLTGSRQDLMPLQVETGARGVSKLRLQIENRDKIFQTTDREINIEF